MSESEKQKIVKTEMISYIQEVVSLFNRIVNRPSTGFSKKTISKQMDILSCSTQTKSFSHLMMPNTFEFKRAILLHVKIDQGNLRKQREATGKSPLSLSVNFILNTFSCPDLESVIEEHPVERVV